MQVCKDMTKTITLTLTENQIREIEAARIDCDRLINAGRCCELMDIGLSVIDLHGLMVTLKKALEKA